MNPFETLLRQHGQAFKIERNGIVVLEIDGLKNRTTDTHRDYVGFMPFTDVQEGDILIDQFSTRYYIEETVPTLFMKKPHEIQAFIVKESKLNRSTSNNSTFNIGNAYGSVIGNQTNFTVNYGAQLEDLKKTVLSIDSPDKEELIKIAELLEKIVNNQEPAHKGALSKFSAIMEKHSWITSSISSILLNWLMIRN